jgi:hypothetical protein
MTRKQIKKVLILSDDFDKSFQETTKKLIEPGKVYYGPEHNRFRFKLTFINTDDFNRIDFSKYDVLLVDYGIVGSAYDFERDSKKVFNNAWSINNAIIHNLPTAWCGGLPSSHYNYDAKIMFPDYKHLHNLRGCGVAWDSILFCLYELLKDK